MNKRGMLGNLIAAGVFIVVSIMLFSTITDAMKDVKESCLNDTLNEMDLISSLSETNLTSSDFCYIFHESSSTLLLWDSIPFFMVLFMMLISWRVISPILRGLGGSDWISDWTSKEEGDDTDYGSYDDDNEKGEYLKESETKLEKKKELNKKPSTESLKERKGVSWGHGVSWGQGVNEYGDGEVKEGDGKDEKDR